MQLSKAARGLFHACMVALGTLALTLATACSSTPNTAPVTSVVDVTPPTSPTPSRTPTPALLEEAGFGGLFVDPDDNSILYIYLVNPSQAAAEAAAVKYYGRDRMQDIKETRPLRAQYTMEQLKEWYDKDLGEARPFSLPEVTMTDLDEGKNRIEVGINCESSRDGVRRELQKRLTLQGVPLEAVVYTVRGRAYPLIGPPVFECVPSETFDPAKELSTPGFGGLYIDSSRLRIKGVSGKRRCKWLPITDDIRLNRASVSR